MLAHGAQQAGAVLARDVPAVDPQVVVRGAAAAAKAAERGAVECQGIVVVPGGTALEFVGVRHSVAVEEDTAARDLQVLDKLMQQIESRGGRHIEEFSIILPFGVIAVGRFQRRPGVLQIGADRLGRRGNGLGILNAALEPLVADALDVGQQAAVGAHAPAAADADAATAAAGADALTGRAHIEGGIAALGNGDGLGIVVVLHQKAVVGDEGVGLRGEEINALVLTVHPHIHRCAVQADAHLMGQIIGHLVAQQGVVVDVGQQAPFFCFFAVNAEKDRFFVQEKVVRPLFLCIVPAVVAAALHPRKVHLFAVDKNGAFAFCLMIAIGVHRRDGFLFAVFIHGVLVNFDKDRPDPGRTLEHLNRKRPGLRALDEAVGGGFAGCCNGQLSAVVFFSVVFCGQPALPGEEAVRHNGVAGQIEMILVRRTGGIRRQIDP